MNGLVGPYAVMIGMLLILHPLTGSTWRAHAARLRSVGASLRKHFPATQDDGAFAGIIETLDEVE